MEIVVDLNRLDPTKKLLQRALGDEKPPQSLTDESVDRLLARAFSNREYVLSVTLLTILNAAGWYYFVYPQAEIGIAKWVTDDAGIVQITEDLAANASPLTMGFAGAYFFVSQMLLRRYLSGDLYPSAFLQAAVRIIVVFTLSVAFAILFNGLRTELLISLAFLAGVFPREGFRLISIAAAGLVDSGPHMDTPGQILPHRYRHRPTHRT